ncbi:Putative fluoride ion transporter CrcB [Sulfitobacter indolifex]|uniref:Fluoride-specific ion channel FluC n=2 Tax=Sulfitobacter indolifex TaxID=225422 RepID=A0ABP2DE89_9RHOB|nr:CrcB-like protein [Sulfitobacter indolifex HEL-45]UOA17784.1 Putative fluoride ion transporter CrcB [Sulfitobacter indolifex]
MRGYGPSGKLDSGARARDGVSMMKTLIMVALGGALGASLRFLVGLAVGFPLGTLAVNVSGSLAIGLVWVLLAEKSSLLLPFLMTGLLGGFTTFSAFSLDTLRLLEAGRAGVAFSYVGASVILSLAACLLGLWVAREVLA